MSKLFIKYNRQTHVFEFREDNIGPDYCDLVAELDTTGETLEFSDLSFGSTVKNDEEVIAEASYPPEGVKYICSDQSVLETHRVSWQPDMVVDIDVWMEQSFGRVEGSYQLTVPRPSQPYPSWTWDGSQWQPPVSYPDDGNDYIWDEDTLSWIEAV